MKLAAILSVLAVSATAAEFKACSSTNMNGSCNVKVRPFPSHLLPQHNTEIRTNSLTRPTCKSPHPIQTPAQPTLFSAVKLLDPGSRTTGARPATCASRSATRALYVIFFPLLSGRRVSLKLILGSRNSVGAARTTAIATSSSIRRFCLAGLVARVLLLLLAARQCVWMRGRMGRRMVGGMDFTRRGCWFLVVWLQSIRCNSPSPSFTLRSARQPCSPRALPPFNPTP